MAIGNRRWLAGSALLPAVLVSRVSWATPSARLVYSRTTEASSCPDEAELRKAVATRLGYDPFFAWARQTVVVQIIRQHGRYAARLQLVDEQGVAHGNREFVSQSATCTEVFEASALAIGIALDAEAANETASRPTTDAQREAAPPSQASAQPTPAPAPPAPVTPAGTPPPPPSTQPPSARLAWSLLADAIVSAGTAPAPAPGLAIGSTLAVNPWSLSLELRADAPGSASRAASLGGGRVVSSLYAAQLVPCRALSYFAVCAVGVLGVTEASGADIVPQQSRSTLFAAAGLRVGVEAPLGAAFFLRVHADGFVDLHRATLSLGQEHPDDVWAAPPVGGTLGIGVARYFR